MDIAAMSMGLAQAQTLLAANVLTMKKGMDVAEVQAQGLIDMLEQAPPAPPAPERLLDIRV